MSWIRKIVMGVERRYMENKKSTISSRRSSRESQILIRIIIRRNEDD